MAYCTIDDILEELDEQTLIELTDDLVEPTGAVNAQNVLSAIERADSIIDGFVSSRYSVPLDSPTQTVKELSVDLAIYTLFTRRMIPLKQRHERYMAAMQFLQDVATGNADLGSSEDGSKPSAIRFGVYAPDPYWSDDLWEKY